MATTLLVVAAIFEMPAMAHQGFAGRMAQAGHPPAAAEHAQGHHAHHGHAVPATDASADLSGAATGSADGDASPCSFCPLCLALVIAPPALAAPERLQRIAASGRMPFDRHPAPDVPPPRLLA